MITFITKEEEPFSNEITVTLRYSTPDGTIRIVNQSGSTSNIKSINSDAITTVKTAIGIINVYETESFIRGILLIDNVYVTLVGTMSLESFSKYCQSILSFN